MLPAIPTIDNPMTELIVLNKRAKSRSQFIVRGTNFDNTSQVTITVPPGVWDVKRTVFLDGKKLRVVVVPIVPIPPAPPLPHHGHHKSDELGQITIVVTNMTGGMPTASGPTKIDTSTIDDAPADP
jgi:hypothetical protein